MARDIQDSVRQTLTSDAGRAIVATAVGEVIRNIRAERKVPEDPLGGLAPQRNHREVLLGVGVGSFVAGAGTVAVTTVAVRRVRKLLSRAPGALADAPRKAAAGTVRAVASRRGGATAARRRSAAESTTDGDRVEARRAQAPAAGGSRGRSAASKTSPRSTAGRTGNRGTKTRRSSNGTSGGTTARTSRSATRSGARSASESSGRSSSASSRKSSGSSPAASRKGGAGQQKKADRRS
jgi:hypothetical protein